MSILERRLQLLLSQEQYQRVEIEAENVGQSVAAVIREGIDLRLDRGSASRREAAARILRETTATSDVGEDWGDIKNIQLAERAKSLT